MSANVEEAVKLPSSEVEFCNYVSPFGNVKTLASRKPEENPSRLRTMIKYCGAALQAGRPLNKVMIVACGESGVGKSSTIKALFNDEACFDGIDTSETREVTEYGKDLCVTAEQPPVKGILSFVDMPGNFHADSLTQTQNLAAIAKFRKTHDDLLSRSSMPDIEKQFSLAVRENVYPNTILFTVKSTDNRMVGPDSALRKSLKALKEHDFLDKNHINLVVVVTHAMSLAAKTYKTKSHEITHNIRTAVFEILQVVDSKVVFVENRPEHYDMTKPVGSDFYQLPDGQLSHYNLIQAMVGQFEANQDYLGSLLCGWYFKDEGSPEKKQTKMKILSRIDHKTLGSEEMTTSQIFLTSMTDQSAESEEDSLPTFQFQNLGRGYCPRTETLRNVIVYRPTENKIIDVLGQKYIFPQEVTVTCEETDCSYMLTQETKDKYEQDRTSSYGLSEKLDVHVDSEGRWVKNNSGHHNSEVTFVYEKRLIQATMQNPRDVVKKELHSAIMQLPEIYNIDSCYLFNEFFSKWGSHFVQEEWIGGSIGVESFVNGATYTAKKGSEIVEELKLYFESCGILAADAQSISVRVDNRMITAFGGDNTGLDTLADVTQERLLKWAKSVQSNPTELSHTFKLYPYYKLVDPPHSSLKEATLDYLAATYLQKLQSRRPKFGAKRNALGWRIVNSITSISNFPNCFPPFSKVLTSRGSTQIGKLKPGDEVLTINMSGGEVRCETTNFCCYLHYDAEKVAEFVVLRLENGRTLTITGDHIVYTYDNSAFKTIRAKKVQVGDMLLSTDQRKPPKIVSVLDKSSKIIKGVYSPLTYSGTIVVDGIFVSCYANVDSNYIAHLSMAPLRMWHNVYNMLTAFSRKSLAAKMQVQNNGSSRVWTNSKIHKYAHFLMILCKWLPFEIIKG